MTASDIQIISSLTLIQASIDFSLWYPVIEVRKLTGWGKPIHIFEWILDWPVTFYLCYLQFQVPLAVMAAFYTLKLFHGCDSIYNIFRYILTNEPTTDKADWRWWSLPFGFPRTIMETIRNKKFTKGEVTIKETWLSTAIGIALSILILLLFSLLRGGLGRGL